MGMKLKNLFDCNIKDNSFTGKCLPVAKIFSVFLLFNLVERDYEKEAIDVPSSLWSKVLLLF